MRNLLLGYIQIVSSSLKVLDFLWPSFSSVFYSDVIFSFLLAEKLSVSNQTIYNGNENLLLHENTPHLIVSQSPLWCCALYPWVNMFHAPSATSCRTFSTCQLPWASSPPGTLLPLKARSRAAGCSGHVLRASNDESALLNLNRKLWNSLMDNTYSSTAQCNSF